MSFNSGTRRVAYHYAVIRNGVELCSIRAVAPPSIDMESTAEVKMSLRGSFAVPTEVDWLTDTLRPYITINSSEYPLGEYVISTVDEPYSMGTVHHELEGFDKGVRVKNMPLIYRPSFPYGKNYLEVVQELLLQCGIDRVLMEPCDAQLQTMREDWEIGDSSIKVINDLLSEINYNSLWFDLRGNARLTKYRQPLPELATHTYRADVVSIIKEESSRTLDSYSAYNDFLALVSSADYEEPLTARATNNDPASALSVPRIGRRTAPIVRLNNIAGQAELQEYVDNLCFRSMMTTEVVTFSTANMPHEVNEIIVLDHPQLKGVYEETEWSMKLEAGADMTHRGKRVIFLA